MAATALFARNEGTADRVIRVVIGVALLYFAFAQGIVWGYFGIVPLLTGLMGSCPLYSLLGMSTCPVKR